MNKRKWLLLTAIIFLVQGLTFSSIVFADSGLLPQTKTDPACPGQLFQKIFDSVCFGLCVYRQDVMRQCAKEDIINTLGRVILTPGIRFDLENMDLIRKGCTRYYPFSIDGKDFVLRIFLTAEIHFQSTEEVLYEGSIQNPPVTFQVLPSLNEILSTCKIKPRQTYSTRQVDGSS